MELVAAYIEKRKKKARKGLLGTFQDTTIKGNGIILTALSKIECVSRESEPIYSMGNPFPVARGRTYITVNVGLAFDSQNTFELFLQRIVGVTAIDMETPGWYLECGILEKDDVFIRPSSNHGDSHLTLDCIITARNFRVKEGESI